MTPLHYASFQGHMGLVALLIEKKAVVDAADDKGITPLHNACFAGQADVAAYLIYKGADVNVEDKEEDTPLHYAVRGDQVELCALLISKKAEWKNCKNRKGLTPITLAEHLNHQAVLEFFAILESEVHFILFVSPYLTLSFSIYLYIYTAKCVFSREQGQMDEP